jgi:hypothetical protein
MTQTKHPEEAEIRAMLDAYLGAFQSLSVDKTLPFYHAPGFALAPGHTLHFAGPEQIRGFLEQNFALMRAQGYAGSRWGERRIFVFFPTAALVSAVWERVNSDGVVIGTSGTTYQLTKASGEWRIISAVMHDEATLLPG